MDFGTTAATGVTFVSGTELTAVSPASVGPSGVPVSGTVDITVTGGAATSADTPADQFTYLT